MKDVLQDTNVDFYAAKESPEMSDSEDLVMQSFTAPYSKEELRQRLSRSRQDYLAGRVYTTAEVLAMCRKQVDQMSIAV
ncbi:MAG: hypothetical protein IIT32_08850 [Bacteroidales bacterium]|nr:hypothetical protein [Bacteroidales bacterium]